MIKLKLYHLKMYTQLLYNGNFDVIDVEQCIAFMFCHIYDCVNFNHTSKTHI